MHLKLPGHHTTPHRAIYVPANNAAILVGREHAWLRFGHDTFSLNPALVNEQRVETALAILEAANLLRDVKGLPVGNVVDLTQADAVCVIVGESCLPEEPQ